jgi:deoxyadenosine/deoxycytidine kinase
MTRPTYIAVAGNIGAGKSSFVTFLRSRCAVEAVFEPNEDNPFLERFYHDMPRWALASQTFFLASKLELHLSFEGRTGPPFVQDRTIWEDRHVFAEHLYRSGRLAEDEFATYCRLFEAIDPRLRRPDLLIYLRCPVRVLRRRIRQRGRSMEQEIPVAYLRSLERLYDNFYEAWDASPKAQLDTEHFDPVTDLFDHRDAIALLERYL